MASGVGFINCHAEQLARVSQSSDGSLINIVQICAVRVSVLGAKSLSVYFGFLSRRQLKRVHSREKLRIGVEPINFVLTLKENCYAYLCSAVLQMSPVVLA